MTNNSHQTLERISRRVAVPEPAYDRLLRRRDRKERNRRLSAAVLAIVIALLSVAGLMRAFRNLTSPATKPTPTPVDRGIFSGMGGWIAYGDASGIWAMDPQRPGTRKQLSKHVGEPVAWSRDGSKVLILRYSGQGSAADETMYVLNADGSATVLIDSGTPHAITGGSFLPDGSNVVYAEGNDRASGIYEIAADGGTPRLLLSARGLPSIYEATSSPDGSRIAYFQGWGDHDNSLRVMNADGSGSRVLLKDAGLMRNSAGLRHLVWSPDGRSLAFGMGYGPYSIYVVGADGSGLKRVIASGVRPQWSPDGSRIAYERLPDPFGGGNDQLYGLGGSSLVIADTDGTHIQRFDNTASGPWNPLDRAQS